MCLIEIHNQTVLQEWDLFREWETSVTVSITINTSLKFSGSNILGRNDR